MPIPSWATIFSENFRSRRRTNIYYSAEANSYQLSDNEDAIILKNRRGKAFSKKASRSRDIIGATKTKDGFSVLIEGTDIQLNERYRVLYANTDGIITSRTNWSTETPLNKGYEEDSISNKPGQISSLSNIFNTASADTDSNGVVDGSELIAYQIHQNGSAITLSNRKGKTFNDLTSRNWDVTHIAKTLGGDGFAVLREGANRKSGLFRVWYTNRFGVITSGTKWKSRLQLASEGHEEQFAIDFDGDGYIGEQPEDDFSNTAETTGTIATGSSVTGELETPGDNDWFRIILDKAYTYHFKVSGDSLSDSFLKLYNSAGEVLASNDDYDGSLDSEIRNFNATESGIYYLDISGYNDTLTGTYSLYAEQITPPNINDGVAAYRIVGSTEQGNTLSVQLLSADPDGNGSPVFTWQKSSDNGQSWVVAGTESQLVIDSSLQGHKIRVNVNYIDGEDFNENSMTQVVDIPNINDGVAAYRIVGSTEQGNTLSVQLLSADPDGNGSPVFTWQKSSDNGQSWVVAGTESQLVIDSSLQGHKIRVNVNYVDGEDFNENSLTQVVDIPTLSLDDYGNSSGSSGNLKVNGSNSGNLEFIGDRDWFKVTLEKDITYEFIVTGNTLSDTYLRLYDRSGSLVGFNDDYGNTFNSKIGDFSATTSGNYYLDVGAYNDLSTGTYDIFANEIISEPSGFSLEDGYGQIDAKAAFEKHFNINLPTVALPGDDQWALNNINIAAVWEPNGSFSGATGSGTTVAVIDTGIDYNHIEFQDKIVGGYDFVDNDDIADDLNNHGTHVAGIIVGTNDGFGVTGVAFDAKVMPIKVLDADGIGFTSDIIAGIYYAANSDIKVDVINLSLGGGQNSAAMQNAIHYATDRDIVVVMAAGNEGGSLPTSPAINAVNYGLAVGAVNQDGNLTSFSNQAGTLLDYVTAPGENITSAITRNRYATYSGTSMAAPFVSGVASLLSGYDSSLTTEQIENLLTSTSHNSISSSTSQNANNYDGLTNTRSLITLETLNDFTNDDLTNPLIGIFGGDATSRKQNASKITSQQGSDLSDFDYFEILDPLTNNFAALAFDSDTESDRLSTLNELLSNNYFESFEIDQKWSIA